jgi:hypothetical protein
MSRCNEYREKIINTFEFRRSPNCLKGDCFINEAQPPETVL